MATPPFIELREIRKKLGSRWVLDRLSLEVRRGETMAILGVSGSGKSVTLRHIVGLMNPDSGRVIIDGQDVTDFDDREFMAVRRKVAFIFQGGALFDSMTVGDNVGFGLVEQRRWTASEIAERVAATLERVGLAGTASSYPADLSGGMRKRVALARSIVLEPACILYDEPTAGLDPSTGYLVSELIKKTAADSQVTSVVVTHDIPAAFHVADRIAFLLDGRIGFLGSCAEARATRLPELRFFLDAYGVSA